jgi:hypothetical protein
MRHFNRAISSLAAVVSMDLNGILCHYEPEVSWRAEACGDVLCATRSDVPKKISKSGYDVTPVTKEQREELAKDLTQMERCGGIGGHLVADRVPPQPLPLLYCTLGTSLSNTTQSALSPVRRPTVTHTTTSRKGCMFQHLVACPCSAARQSSIQVCHNFGGSGSGGGCPALHPACFLPPLHATPHLNQVIRIDLACAWLHLIFSALPLPMHSFYRTAACACSSLPVPPRPWL